VQNPTEADLVEECDRQALALLARNAGPAGVLACTPGPTANARHYDSVFARDAALCTPGLLASGDPALVEAARAGLVTLARHQARSGEIPNFVSAASGEADFWYVGAVDATAWWLLAVHLAERRTGPLGLEAEVGRALAWLAAQAHPAWGLVRQTEASDWADILPRSGFVLATNALWYAVQRRFGLPDAERTRVHAALVFDPAADDREAPRRLRVLRAYAGPAPDALWRGHVDLGGAGDEGDVVGNLLAGLAGLMAPASARAVADALWALGVHEPAPVRSVVRPIEPESARWRPYMRRHEQNLPFQYHNGGVWPFAGGLWVLLLARLGDADRARAELRRLAALNAREGWAFQEWFHGVTGAPGGMRGQSWNAALFVRARRALDEAATPPLLSA
jgi:glycogen debranching enzyme